MIRWGKWKGRAHIALYVVGLIIFLELCSAVVLNNLVSSSRMERFDLLFLEDIPPFEVVPHPTLTHVTSRYEVELERYLGYLHEDRTDKIYVVALGGSTTENGYPNYTEHYLNRRLEEMNSSMRVVVFNFGVAGWNSQMSLQNYMYVIRYLHPDIVVIHHNLNEIIAWNVSGYQPFRQSVLYYPWIRPWERTLLRNSRFYKLLKITYLIAYNPLRYGKKVVHSEGVDLPMQARFSSALNEEGFYGDRFFRIDFTKAQLPEIPLGFILTENYESLIKFTRADNSTLIITTQYFNASRFFQFCNLPSEKGKQLQEMSRDINTLLRNISANHNITLVDLEKEMEAYDYLLFKDGIHFIGTGSIITGELIGEAIFEILKEQYNLSG